MRQILLTQDKIALVDDDTYLFIGHLKWYAHFDKGNWYAVRSSSKKDGLQDKRHTLHLHHYVVGFPLNKYEVDHIDGNGLNNQRDNLRIVSHSSNDQNRKEHRNGHLVGTTLVKRKYKNKFYNYWQAQIRMGKKIKHLGLFKTEQEANEAYLEFLDKLK